MHRNFTIIINEPTIQNHYMPLYNLVRGCNLPVEDVAVLDSITVSLGMVTVLVLMICMIFVLQNFNTGLKKKGTVLLS